MAITIIITFPHYIKKHCCVHKWSEKEWCVGLALSSVHQDFKISEKNIVNHFANIKRRNLNIFIKFS